MLSRGNQLAKPLPELQERAHMQHLGISVDTKPGNGIEHHTGHSCNMGHSHRNDEIGVSKPHLQNQQAAVLLVQT